jgi:hypothetical protein
MFSPFLFKFYEANVLIPGGLRLTYTRHWFTILRQFYFLCRQDITFVQKLKNDGRPVKENVP